MVLGGSFDIFHADSKSVKNELIKTAGLSKSEALIKMKESFAVSRNCRFIAMSFIQPKSIKSLERQALATYLYLSTALTELSAHTIISNITKLTS